MPSKDPINCYVYYKLLFVRKGYLKGIPENKFLTCYKLFFIGTTLRQILYYKSKTFSNTFNIRVIF